MSVLHFVPIVLTYARTRCTVVVSDCIEAGLPYDWTRLGIDPDKEEKIVRALLVATGDHPPAASGRDSTSAPARTRAKNVDEEVADGSFGAPGADGKHPAAPSGACGAKPRTVLPAVVLCPPTPVSTRTGTDTLGSCVGATTAVGATAEGEGQRGAGAGDRGGDGSHSANVAMRSVSPVENGGGHAETSDGGSNGGCSSDGENSSGTTSTARVAPAGRGGAGSAEGVKGASGVGRWDSVRLKEVKELAPSAEYWEIRMVLARLKADEGGAGRYLS